MDMVFPEHRAVSFTAKAIWFVVESNCTVAVSDVAEHPKLSVTTTHTSDGWEMVMVSFMELVDQKY